MSFYRLCPTWMGLLKDGMAIYVGRGRLEKSIKLGVDLVGDGSEVFRTMLVVEVVCFDDEHFALVVGDPLLVAVVEVAEVLDADALLVFTSSLLNLCHEGWD